MCGDRGQWNNRKGEMVKELEMVEEGQLQSECVVMGTLKVQLIGIPFQGCERRYY